MLHMVCWQISLLASVRTVLAYSIIAVWEEPHIPVQRTMFKAIGCLQIIGYVTGLFVSTFQPTTSQQVLTLLNIGAIFIY